ncbi:hypothetical protein FIBSPDRAFT_876933, partial [Athelia psychrophila]
EALFVDSMWTRRRDAGVKRWIMRMVSYLTAPRRMCINITLTRVSYTHPTDDMDTPSTSYITSRYTEDAPSISNAYVLRTNSECKLHHMAL